MSLIIQGSLILTDVLNGHPQEDQVRQLQEVCKSRRGHNAIAQPHMTVLSSRDLKPLQKRSGMSNREFREWMKHMIPNLPPAPDFAFRNDVYFAKEGEKESCYLQLDLSVLLVLMWREEIMEALGVLVEDIEPRYTHISITNLTGNRIDSIANPRGEEE